MEPVISLAGATGSTVASAAGDEREVAQLAVDPRRDRLGRQDGADGLPFGELDGAVRSVEARGP